MKQVIHKLYWAWQFEEEEQWLNQMAAKGMHLTDVGFFRYVFQLGKPGQYQYRLQLLEHFPNHPESQHYLQFMEETGAEYVGAVKRWTYFRKEAANGPFQLFSDMDSWIKQLRRIFLLMLALCPLVLVAAAGNLVVGIQSSSPGNLGVAIPYLLMTGLIGWGALRLYRCFRRLQRERGIHE